jgi:predicted DCC family thiol-disulfide oxidoreductase YuxK
MNERGEHIVFYDGDCGLCQRTVQFVLKHEKQNSGILFSSLHSDFTKAFFSDRGLPLPNFSTFYFYSNGMLSEKSTAALRLATFLKFPYSFLRIGFLCPKFLRDSVYSSIAKRRNKWFQSTCILPNDMLNKRFLK